jgi:hypothetical protein
MLGLRVLFHFVVTAVAALGFAGCYSTLQIGIESDTKSNAGRPFYVMVRKADGKAFISEDYKLVSKKLFSYPKEKSILESRVIIPGQAMEMIIKKPEDIDLALYFFFTEPGDNWRVPIRRPFPAKVLIDLGSNQIKRVRIQKR